METFFLYLKRTLFAFTLSIFAFTVVYVPQSWHETPVAEAGGGAYGLETTQILNKIKIAASFIQEKATAVATTYSATADAWIWLKENALDGIAWRLAKATVSQITSSIINWINSGFKGSPAFITDLPGFLLEVADGVAGEFIEGLGEVGSFICSPFRLDVQISLAVLYDQGREGTQSAPTCTLTGIIDNVEGFIGGLTDLSQGGWNDWFDITARPDMYTPYGQVLTAQAGLRAALVNAKGKEITIANWGEGFLSGEICDIVEGAGTPREDCFISKPGQIIEEALTFTTSTGQRSLIAADEFDEIISALVSQLAQQVVTGAAGLLGLSSGTGYTESGYAGSFVDQMAADALGSVDAASILNNIRDAERNERAAWNYITGAIPAAANSPINRLQASVNSTLGSGEADVLNRERAQLLLSQMIEIRDRNATPPSTTLTTDGNILTATRLIPILEIANNPSASLADLRNAGAGLLSTGELSATTDAASLRSLLITSVVQEFSSRTYIRNTELNLIKEDFASINPPNSGGGGGGVAAEPIIPPTVSEPTFPTAPPAPGGVTTPTSPSTGSGASESLPPPPPPPRPLGG